MKLLEGYVKNRTKEAALAAMLMALFFVGRTFKIQILPFFLLDISGIIVFTAASVFSWPYTIIFSLVTLYQGSTIFMFPAFIIGTQVTFILSRLVGKKWAAHTPVFGDLTCCISNGIILHVVGILDFRAFIMISWSVILLYLITTYAGGRLIWAALRRFEIVD